MSEIKIKTGHIQKALLLLFFISLIPTSLYTMIHFYTIPQRSVYVYGVAENVEYDPIEGVYSFTLKQNNLTIGTATISSKIENHDTVFYINCIDSVEIPHFFEPREWEEIYVNNEKVNSTIPRFPMIELSLFYVILILGILFLWNKSKSVA